jgi:hypothetical protein
MGVRQIADPSSVLIHDLKISRKENMRSAEHAHGRGIVLSGVST